MSGGGRRQQARSQLSPEMLSPGNPSGQTRMVTAARRRDRAKFAAPPIVHSLACSRGSNASAVLNFFAAGQTS